MHVDLQQRKEERLRGSTAHWEEGDLEDGGTNSSRARKRPVPKMTNERHQAVGWLMVCSPVSSWTFKRAMKSVCRAGLGWASTQYSQMQGPRLSLPRTSSRFVRAALGVV